MSNFIQIQRNLKNTIAPLMFFLICSISTNTFAGIDTTVFRINCIQDSVYVGDTVDVDIFIGGDGLLGILNSLKSFEIEIKSDTALFVQDDIQFKLDSASLELFFGTLISNINTVVGTDPVLGLLNVNTNASRQGNGNARVGRGKYIVQDNVAGRQIMPYGFSKSISRDLLGFDNPVKLVTDSVIIIGKRNQIPTTVFNNRNMKVNISPNPVSDILHIKAENIQHYKLLNYSGNEIYFENKFSQKDFDLDLNLLNPGVYILMLQTDGKWSNYKIIKK